LTIIYVYGEGSPAFTVTPAYPDHLGENNVNDLQKLMDSSGHINGVTIMNLAVNNTNIETNEVGFLSQLGDWSEDFASEQARSDGVTLFVDHWELIWYFREYYEANKTHPSMHILVTTLGKMKGEHFHNQKNYEEHIYNLFPTDPIHEVCKLAGLPMPPPDT